LKLIYKKNLTSVFTLFRFKKYLFEINFYTHKVDLKFKTGSTVEMFLRFYKKREADCVKRKIGVFNAPRTQLLRHFDKSVPTVDLILNQFKPIPLTPFRTTRKINPMK